MPLKDGNKLSIYTGNLTLEVFMIQADRLRKVFKNIDKDWFEVLKERLKANKFTDERLKDAVDNLFDKFKYGHTPNIAEIIDFDRTIELTSHKQICDLLRDDKEAFKNYTVVEIEGKPRYILKEYQQKYNLKLFKFEEPVKKSLYPDLSDEEREGTVKIMRELIDQIKLNDPVLKKQSTAKPKFLDKNGKAYQEAKKNFEKDIIAEKMKQINL